MTTNQGLMWVAQPTTPPTPFTDFIKDRLPGSSNDWATVSTVLDVVAGVTDLYAVGVVVTGGVMGTGLTSPFILEGLPEVPVATGWAGAAIAELYVQPVLRGGNIIATLSTAATVVSETKAGTTIIETGQLSKATMNSIVITSLGWGAPSEAFISLVFQSTAILNDFGGVSIPYR